MAELIAARYPWTLWETEAQFGWRRFRLSVAEGGHKKYVWDLRHNGERLADNELFDGLAERQPWLRDWVANAIGQTSVAKDPKTANFPPPAQRAG